MYVVEELQFFLDSCRSPETRNTYEFRIKKYLDFAGNPKEVKEIESKIIQF